MNVAKNWALTIMLIALAFADCSSELLFKEQIIIPVKKTLNNAGHIDAKLIDFSEICQKKSSEIGCFLLIVSWRSFPPKFPVKLADFSANLPLKSFEIWLFAGKPQRNRPIFLRISTCFPCENPVKSADFSANLPLKIPPNFAFFPWNIRSPDNSYNCNVQCIYSRPKWHKLFIFKPKCFNRSTREMLS